MKKLTVTFDVEARAFVKLTREVPDDFDMSKVDDRKSDEYKLISDMEDEAGEKAFFDDMFDAPSVDVFDTEIE